MSVQMRGVETSNAGSVQNEDPKEVRTTTKLIYDVLFFNQKLPTK